MGEQEDTPERFIAPAMLCLDAKHSQWSPKAFVVKTSLSVTEFECWIFFHMSTSIMHLVLTRRKPGHIKHM